MSIDNITLTPLIVQNLFEKTLVSKQENNAVPKSQPSGINFLGGNNKNITVIIKNSETAFLPDDQLNFLTGILNACKLNLNDVAIINIYQNKNIDEKKINANLQPKFVLLFGVTPAEIDLPFAIPQFQIQSFNNQKIICSPSLDILENDIDLKKQLWASLKQIFL